MWRPSVLLLLLALTASVSSASAKPWSPRTFPDPAVDWASCGAKAKSHVCDPDGLLTAEQHAVLDGMLMDIEDGKDPYARHSCSGELAGYQVRSG